MEYVIVYARSLDRKVFKSPFVLKSKPDFLVGILNLPGGKVEQGEHPIDAGVRELKEETGLDALPIPPEFHEQVFMETNIDETGIYAGHIMGDYNIIHCIQCFVDTDQKINPHPDEVEKIDWYDIRDVFKSQANLMPNLRAVIPLLEAGQLGWQIIDKGGEWRTGEIHQVSLNFPGMQSIDDVQMPLCISLPTVAYMERMETENYLKQVQ